MPDECVMAITMKAVRLLPLSVVTFAYLMLTGLDLSATETGDKLPATNSDSIDVTDLEKPPNLATPYKDGKTDAVAAEAPGGIATNSISETTKQAHQLEPMPTPKASIVLPQKRIKNDASQRILDLSMPFKEGSNDSSGQDNAPQNQEQEPTIFTQDTPKKSQPIRLDGNVLMSQEPEAEKRKTVDGAGITLNLKP